MPPAPAPTYDAIAEEYKRSKSLPFRKHIEAYTLFRLIGDPTGLAVLDLACGDGIYTREVRRRGAGKALGVDVSQEMLRLAEASERADPLGCRYFLSDVLNLRRLGSFDVVIGAYLLNYARSADDLLRFCRAIHSNLRPGGRFVGVNENMANPPERYGSYRKYGFIKSCPLPRREGDPITFTLFDAEGGSFQFDNYWLAPETYEQAFREAGFASFEWCDLELSEEGERAFPKGYWDDFLAPPPPLIALRAARAR
jgi:toxoflavin synthase